MLQEDTIGWNLESVNYHPPFVTRIYFLYLLVAMIVVTVKIMRLWIAVPPFRLARPAQPSDYLHKLHISVSSVNQWIVCTLLACGTFIVITTHRVSLQLAEQHLPGSSLFLFGLGDVTGGATVGLEAAMAFFLARWHILKRIEFLGARAVPGSNVTRMAP